MGARCTGLTQHKERILYKERHQGLFSGPYNSGKSIRNLLFLGLEGAGKTTLLYTTLVPNWSSPLLSNIKPTETFHYEVFHYGHLKFGMWEVSGSTTMQKFWPFYYKHIHFEILFFVVSALDPYIGKAKTWIKRLVNEDELRDTLIIIIINEYDDMSSVTENTVESVVVSLALEDIAVHSAQPGKFHWFNVNVKNGQRDGNWSKIISNFIFPGLQK